MGQICIKKEDGSFLKESEDQKKLISNSFNFLKSKVISIEKFQYDQLGFREIPLFNKNGKVDIFFTNTRDFNEARIRKIRNLDQIYVSKTKEKHSNDFSKSYRKLFFDKKLEVYKVLDKDIFKEEDMILLKLLKNIKGKILDVGCGESLYLNLIKDKLNKGDISYIGLESDEKIVERIKKKETQLNIKNISIEEFEGKEEYDFILILRSINHFKDVFGVVKKCFDLLKIGGKMVVCDNGPFAVIQKHLKTENGNESQKYWQHYHDLFSNEFLKIVKSLNLRILFRKDVSKMSANQWVVLLEKYKK